MQYGNVTSIRHVIGALAWDLALWLCQVYVEVGGR